MPLSFSDRDNDTYCSESEYGSAMSCCLKQKGTRWL